jgi:GTP-binding protein Era
VKLNSENSETTAAHSAKHGATHCGFIAIIGRPNVGKSTLMNHLIGQKVSITSRKPQTTQHKINGVLSIDDYQYVFVDTPGFQTRYVNKLNTLLNTSVVSSLSNVDVVLFVVEAGIFNDADMSVLKLLPKDVRVVLVVNKEDKLKNKAELSRFVREVKDQLQQSSESKLIATVLVAAKHHSGMEELLEAIKPALPAGEFLYADDQLTDKSSKFLVSEILREKLFRYLGEELPYSVAVEINEFKVEAKITRISATIIVDKENQKGIVIGNGGEKLKKISSDSRVDMESLLNTKVFLQVWVKVKGGFADDAKFLKQFES